MIKFVYVIRKREDISSEEFYRYWLQEHGPLVKSVADELGACRYLQSHTVLQELNAGLQEGRGSMAAYDGITELWWESQADMEQGLATEAGLAAAQKLLEDERHFIDFANSSLFMTEEHEVF